MRVLVACEFSGTVREAFAKCGHDAWSCDLLPTDIPGQHIVGDVRPVLKEPWDLVIAHPPCTYLTVAANKWMKPEYAARFPERPRLRQEAYEFFMLCYNANSPRVCVENPVSVIASLFRPCDQLVQPWMFGHPVKKGTCFWLRGLSPLVPTQDVRNQLSANPRDRNPLNYLGPSPERWKLRSKTYTGIAAAMAAQWGSRNETQSDLYFGSGRIRPDGERCTSNGSRYRRPSLD